MRIPTLALLSLPAVALGAATSLRAPSNGVGDPLPVATLEDFTQTRAESLDDYVGRAILLEFFAHW